jgi:leader peptidase (prepilin peptidase)/N-methyltransferase
MTAADVALRLLVAVPLGLAFGSFLTVVIHRVPEGESVVSPRSRCPRCGTELRNRDNIPVLSWVLLRGRCRSCGEPISAVYPLVELACGGLFAAVALLRDDVWAAALLAPFLAILVAISIIDIRHRRIPNRIVYPAIVVSAAFIAVADLAGSDLSLPDAAIGFAAYGGVLLVVALVSPRGMGMGDVKLAALIGLVCGSLGLEHVAVAAGVGIVLGGIGAIVALAAGATRKSALPFGPFLAAGAVVSVVAGEAIADAYLRFVT